MCMVRSRTIAVFVERQRLNKGHMRGQTRHRCLKRLMAIACSTFQSAKDRNCDAFSAVAPVTPMKRLTSSECDSEDIRVGD